MQDLPGTVLEGAANGEHLAANIDAGQQPLVTQPLAQGLFANAKALGTR